MVDIPTRFPLFIDVSSWCMYDSMLLVLIVWHRSLIWLKNGILGFVGDGYVTNLCKRVLEGVYSSAWPKVVVGWVTYIDLHCYFEKQEFAKNIYIYSWTPQFEKIKELLFGWIFYHYFLKGKVNLKRVNLKKSNHFFGWIFYHYFFKGKVDLEKS